MSEEETGRQYRVPIACAANCLIARVFHQTVAFVHQDDRRKVSAASWMGQKRGHSVLANDVLRRDVARGLSFGAGRGAKRCKSAKESELCKEFTPWWQYHCCPPFRNRFYIGEVAFKGEVLKGEQIAIVDRACSTPPSPARCADQRSQGRQDELRSPSVRPHLR